MDRFLYIAMSGAKETMRAQAVNNHNLANVSTAGFRADLAAFQSRAVVGSGYDSRAYASTAGGVSIIGEERTNSMAAGSLRGTGRDPSHGCASTASSSTGRVTSTSDVPVTLNRVWELVTWK